MPNKRHANAARLEFNAGTLVHTNLSGAAITCHGSQHWLWVSGDEACGIDRLALLPGVGGEALRFGQAQDFALADLLDLPGQADDEADLEGLAWADGWLWLAGSHGFKRKNTKPDLPTADNARRLAKTALDANRRLIARIPIEAGPDGLPHLVRQAADGRRAMRLKGDALHNELSRVLAEDRHLGPFVEIPGKDNGLDIEGLAVLGARLLLGLRGPVLRGWACVLEIELGERDDQLRLVPLDKAGTLVRKHFLPLEGLGVRDLSLHGDDLYILAGPTMVLDGDVRLFKWAGAGNALRANSAEVSFAPAPQQSLLLPHGRGCNRAEALCELPPALAGGGLSWLVLYDAPGADRRDGEFTVFGDVLQRG